MRALFDTPVLKGSAILFSTIVGAGVLGLPAVIARVGLVVGIIYTCGIGLLLLAAHIALGEIYDRTRGRLQMSGVVRRVLGEKTAALMIVVFLLLHVGALVAYLIGEGQSLSALFGGAPEWWTLIFYILGSAIIYRGTTTIAAIDVCMSVVTIGGLFCFGMWGIFYGKFLPLAPQPDSSLLLPLGVLLFAFHGTASIAEVHALTGRSRKKCSRAIFLGSLMPIILYIIFVIGVVRVTGIATTDVATQGLGAALGRPAAILGNLFAALLMGTSFITIGLALKRLYEWDFGLSPRTAWALAVGLPALIYAVGAREFIDVIAVVGGTCGTIELIIIGFTWWRVKHAAI